MKFIIDQVGNMKKDRITNNSQIKYFKSLFNRRAPANTLLVGGAVVDILENRKPKDYDFINLPQYILDKLHFQYDSKTATTYVTNDGTIVQNLKTEVKDFEFTISQSSYHFTKDILVIDEKAFVNKTLIPVTYSNKKQVSEALRRIPHWRSKGYNIHDMTYLSLVNSLSGTRNTETDES